MANVHTCFDMFWQVVSMTNPLPEHYIDTPNNWLQNTTTRSNKRQKVSVKGTGKYHSGDQNNWFILEDREIYLRRSVHAYYWYVFFFLCVCVCRSICVHLISWSIGIQLCIYIYTLYINMHKNTIWLYVSVGCCHQLRLSEANNDACVAHCSLGWNMTETEPSIFTCQNGDPVFWGGWRRESRVTGVFYQWIPGKTKRPKKTKRLGGSKALHLIWGIFALLRQFLFSDAFLL